MARHNALAAKARQSRYESALQRPELRRAQDNFARVAPASPTGAAIKTTDAGTRALIDAALAKRNAQAAG